MPQPTPQYEHAVLVTATRSWSAAPVPVGFRRRYREDNSYSPRDYGSGEHRLRRSGGVAGCECCITSRNAGRLLVQPRVTWRNDGRIRRQTYTINGQISCVKESDGKLLINAAEGGKKLIRVQLGQENRPVVEAAGFRFNAVNGFTIDSDEAWATKVDNTYTISGRMPPGNGQIAAHQFKIEVTCERIEEFRPPPPRPPDIPRIPRP